MKTGCIRYGYDAALMILSHVTINNMKQFVLFVTTKQSTFNFFRPPSRGRKKIFSLANTSPPISIFVILTLNTRRLGKFGDFRRKSPLLSETVRDRPMVTMER